MTLKLNPKHIPGDTVITSEAVSRSPLPDTSAHAAGGPLTEGWNLTTARLAPNGSTRPEPARPGLQPTPETRGDDTTDRVSGATDQCLQKRPDRDGRDRARDGLVGRRITSSNDHPNCDAGPGEGEYT